MDGPIRQRRRSFKQTFTFDEEDFTLNYKNSSGYGELNIDYLDLPSNPVVVINQHRSALYVGIAFFVLGIVILIGLLVLDADAEYEAVPIWAGLGTFFILLYYWTKSIYTVYANERVNIWVLQDKNHDTIINEIRTRRIRRLRDEYFDLNPLNAPEAELKKYKWLLSQEAITQDEFDEKMRLMEADVS